MREIDKGSDRRIRFDFEMSMPGKADPAFERRNDDSTLRILVGTGRACVLRGMENPTIVVPLRERVKITEGESTRILHRGELLVSEGASPLQAIGSGGSLWIALIAPGGVWRPLVDAISDERIAAPILLPAVHLADRTIRRAAVRLAREVRDAAASERSEIAALRFVALLLDLQSAFDSRINRCPGRTHAQRRSVFLRLQRVCNYMESSGDLDLDIAGFARVANYSPCHFIRTFNAVYGKTPHAVLIELRLKRALRLVNDTELSIAEVAHAAGFEDRCAFARSFKRHYGQTATAVRERRLAYAAGAGWIG